MGKIDVVIPVDAEVARVLESSSRREAAGRYLSAILRDGGVAHMLAEAIAEAKQEGLSNGLTAADVDAEIDAWRADLPG